MTILSPQLTRRDKGSREGVLKERDFLNRVLKVEILRGLEGRRARKVLWEKTRLETFYNLLEETDFGSQDREPAKARSSFTLGRGGPVCGSY